MSQKRITVGTSAIQIAPPNDRRIGIVVEFVPATIETGNTGALHVNKDGPPSVTAGQPTSGSILLESDIFSDRQSFANDPSIHKGAFWAIADTAGQIIVVDDIVQ